MTRFILFGLICLNSAFSNEKIQLYPALIKPLKQKEHRKESMVLRSPFFAHYKKNKKELIYIGAWHSNQSGGPTHLLIDKVLKKFRPEVAIGEIEPWRLFKLKTRKNICQRICPESHYLFKTARQKGIKFETGESSLDLLKKDFLKQGKNERELIFLDVYRQVAHWSRRPPSQQERQLRTYIRRSKERYKVLNLEYTPQIFFADYKKTMKENFHSELTSGQDLAPYVDGHGINKLAHLYDIGREKGIIATLQRMLDIYDKVLIVYGSGHFHKHRKVLEKAFGQPKLYTHKRK